MTAYISRRRRRWDIWGRLGWVTDTEGGVSTIDYEDLRGNHYTARADTGSDGVAFEHDGALVDAPVEDTLFQVFGLHTELGIFAPLAGDIAKNGLQWPVILGQHGGIVGANRLKAAGALGWETIPAYVVPLERSDFRGM